MSAVAKATKPPRDTVAMLSEILRSDRVTSDPDAEAAVLSSTLLDPAALPRVIDFLEPQHFSFEEHRQIYNAAVELFRRKEPVDVQTVASELRARGRLAQVGGMPGLGKILDSAPHVRNVRSYGVFVHDMWRRRQVIVACQRFALRAMDDVPSVQGFVEEVITSFGRIGNQNPVKPVESLEATLASIIDRVFNPPDPNKPIDRLAVPLKGFPIGLHSVDRLLGGLRIAAKTTIVALTGVGKTAMLLQIALFVAKQGIGVLIFSTEISREECCLRLLAQESGVPARKIQEGLLTDAQRAAVKAAQKVIDTLPLVIDETARVTIEQVASIVKAEKEKMLFTHRVRLGLVGFDYAQRCEPSSHKQQKEKHEQIGHFTRGFKQLMQEEKLAGVELAQAKSPKQGAKKVRPNVNTDIADCSQIGKEADEVIFLEAENEPTDLDPRVHIVAWIGKNRAGPKAKEGVPLEYRGDLYRFRDLNTPNPMASPSRQYIDPIPEPPPGRFDDDDDDGSTTLTGGL